MFNAISAAEDTWHKQQEMVAVLPHTQHGPVCAKAGIKGLWVLGEI